MPTDQFKIIRSSSVNSDNTSLFQYKDLKRAWRLLLTHWYIALIIVSLSLGVYLYMEHSTVKGALARVQISLKYNETNTKDYKDYSEEMTGINAPSLINQTIESLRLDVSYFVKDGGNYTEIYDNVPFKVNSGVVSPDFHEKYLTIKLINENLFELSYERATGTERQRSSYDSLIITPDIRLEISKRTAGSENTTNEYFIQIHERSALVEKMQRHLKTDITNDLAVLQVVYRDIFPKRAVAFLDTLSRTYLNNTIKSQIERNNKMVGGIDRLLKGTEQALRVVEDSLRKYQQKTGAFNESLEDQQYMTMLTDAMLGKKKLELQLMNLQSFEKYISEHQDATDLPPPYFGENEDAFLENSLTELYKMQVKKKESFFDITDKNKNTSRLDNSFDIRKEDLIKYIKNSQKVIAEKIIYAEKQIQDLGDPAKRGYDKNQLYVMELQRQLKVNEAMYMSLLERRNSILIAQAAMAPEYKIFETAHIIEQGSSSGGKKLFFFIAGSLILSLIVIYIKDFFYQRIESLEDLKQKTTIPILGEMPYLDPRKENLQYMINAYSNPLTSSLLRSVRTNIELILGDKKSKVILLTSHTSGEGKTFNAVNIAAILAIANKKVLLLDMDFHKPNIKNALGIEAEIGMNAVYNKNISFSDAVTKTAIKNLDVILMEKSLKEGSEMILSNKTKEIIEYGKEHYDYVIIDTAPVGLISDASMLMKFSDMNIYILNAATPYNEAITQAHEIIEKNNFNIHFILNKVQAKRLQYYSRNYKNYRYAYAS